MTRLFLPLNLGVGCKPLLGGTSFAGSRLGVLHAARWSGQRRVRGGYPAGLVDQRSPLERRNPARVGRPPGRVQGISPGGAGLRQRTGLGRAVFSDVHLHNFGAFSDFRWSGRGQRNVVVGENDTGKSHLLRGCTPSRRASRELATRQGGGPEEALSADVFRNKLRWTFQTSSIGAMIHDDAESVEYRDRAGG